MDEPTTGLDSAAAWRLMKILRKIADSGVSVIAVVHQPSTRMYNLFHDIILLENGKSVYVGPRKKAFNYFEYLGYNISSMKNPAEFLVDILVGLELPTKESVAHNNSSSGTAIPVDLGNLWKDHGQAEETWREVEIRMQGYREKETLILKKFHGEKVPSSLLHNQVDYCDETYPSVFKFGCLVYLGFQQSYFTFVPKPGLLPQTWLWFVRFSKLIWRRGFIFELLNSIGLASTITFTRSYCRTWNRKPMSNFFLSVTVSIYGLITAVINDEAGPVKRAASAGMLLTAHELAHVCVCLIKSWVFSRMFSTVYLTGMYLRQGISYSRKKIFEFMHIIFLEHLCAQGQGSLICVLVDHDMARAYIGCILMLIYTHFFALYTPSKDQIDTNSMVLGKINTAPIINLLCSVSSARYFMEAILLWEPNTSNDAVGRNFVIRYFNYREEHKTMCLTCIFAIWIVAVFLRLICFMLYNSNTQHQLLLPLFAAFMLKVILANAVALLAMTIIHEWPRLKAAWKRTVVEFNDHHFSKLNEQIEDEDVDIVN